jgi:hypothetical protein
MLLATSLAEQLAVMLDNMMTINQTGSQLKNKCYMDPLEVGLRVRLALSVLAQGTSTLQC